MALAYIAVGSNLGNRRQTINLAKMMIGSHPRIQLRRESSVIETAPLGNLEQENFFNTVWEIETNLSAALLMQTLLDIEMSLGRVRTMHHGPRTIDLDLLLYENEIRETEFLTLPHPRFHERRFVLDLLAEINPDIVHPKLQKSIQQLLEKFAHENRSYTLPA